jgi:hypothetical protein
MIFPLWSLWSLSRTYINNFILKVTPLHVVNRVIVLKGVFRNIYNYLILLYISISPSAEVFLPVLFIFFSPEQ